MVMPRHHVQHAQNVGPILFAHNENSDVMHALHGTCMQASRQPLCKHGAPEITDGHAICTSRMIFIKINSLTF